MVNWIQKKLLDLLKSVKEMNELLKSDKIEAFIVVWILFFS
jgi:hypothetical protein